MPNYWKLMLPTRFVYESIRDSKSDSQARQRLFKLAWPSWLLGIEVCSAILLSLNVPAWAVGIVGCFAASRVGEIVYAYYNDAMDSLSGRTAKDSAEVDRNPTSLTKPDRIRLAIRSYLSLVIDWALIFFSLPIFTRSSFLFHIQSADNCATACAFTSISDSLYFSGVTISTVGFGDITPTHAIAKLLTVGEVLVGMLILVLALSTYFSEKPSEAY